MQTTKLLHCVINLIKTTIFVRQRQKVIKMGGKKNLISYFLLLIIIISSNTYSQDIIINKGGEWNYFDEGYLPVNWQKNIDIEKWKKGYTPIGYGDASLVTEIKYGKEEDNKDLVKYFTKTFIVDSSKYNIYELRIRRDDGAIIYLNGKEVHRENILIDINGIKPERAISSNEERKYFSTILTPSSFLNGKNSISVSIHQINKKSSDCIFDLELIGHKNLNTVSKLVESKDITNEIFKNEIATQLDINKKASENNLLSNTNYNLKLLIFIISTLLVIAIIGYFFLIQTMKIKEKIANDKLLQLNKFILEKEKEMMIMTTNLLHNRQHFKEIRTEIKDIKTENPTVIKKIINQIDYFLEKDEDWGNLKKHFNAIYSGFYDALIEAHPTLTETELRHCMFIKLHLQTKEISQILFIDPRSVQTSRYRIKKKMNLGENEDLRSYLLKI